MRHKVTERLKRDFKLQARAFKVQWRETRKRPNARNVHRSRVIIRRIRTDLWLMEHSNSRFRFRRLNRRLKSASHFLGQIRQIDSTLQATGLTAKDRGFLKIQRKAAQKRFRKHFGHRRQRRIWSQLEKALRKVKNTNSLDLEKGFGRLENSLKPYLSRKKLTNDEAHRLRIKIKRLRYALEAVGQTPRSLNTLQDSLGRAHDLVILQTLTKRNPQIQNQISREYSRALKKLKAYFFVLAFERAAAKAPPKAPPIEALV